MPRVSVIIPTFNYARFLEIAVQSVLDQTYQDFELIVVDDGSTDNTKQVMAGFEHDSRVKYVFQSNLGDAAARNTGIRQSAGQYLAFLDSDDSWLPDKLQKQVEILENSPEISLVYCAVFLHHANGRVEVLEAPMLQEKTLYEELLYTNVIVGSHSSVLLRREAIDRVGLFDEDFHICDVDLWRRLSEHHLFFYVNEPLVRIIKHEANISKNTVMMAENHVKYLEKLRVVLPKQYQYHLPRVATLRFGYYTLGFLKQGKLLLAAKWGIKTICYAWRCPVFFLGLVARVLRVPGSNSTGSVELSS